MNVPLRKLLTAIILIVGSVHLFGQDFKRTPKDYAVHLSYNHHLRYPFANTAAGGLGLELDHSWQLSGYQGGRKSFITVPLGYRYFVPKGKDIANTRELYYGWKVRHNLKKGIPKWQPFLGYSLLLNQLWVEGYDGNIIGHETRFTLGVDRWTTPKLSYIFSLDFSYSRYPILGRKKAPKSMEVGIKLGVRFL